MRLRYFEYRKGRIEIIPMIDVMLFLLVFFIIVTLQMIPDAGVNLQLPRASAVQHLPHPKVTVNLLGDGSMQVKGHTLTAAELTALLAADGNPAKTQVTVAADKQVPFQFFIDVMDAARKAGVTDIGVAAQPTGAVAGPPTTQTPAGSAPQPAGTPTASHPPATPPSPSAATAATPAPSTPPAAAPPATAPAVSTPAGSTQAASTAGTSPPAANAPAAAESALTAPAKGSAAASAPAGAPPAATKP
ncbi:MAG TPA: biopolymer transporter ExbD [Acetobacteraceae bacterium]|jgi:biopolymer transport protein ExbD|nr:biopolymer transporter ExbD [Acetobacteraceae bacterium]